MALVSDHPDTPNPKNGNPIPAERVWEMLKAIDIAMLVTNTGDGPQGRPMSTIPRPEKGLIYILTEASSSAAREIASDVRVFLCYQGQGDYVALQGQAHVSVEKGLVKDLWNPGAQIFWPNGPDAHDVVALVIDPGHADVWDGPGVFRGIASVVKAAVKRESPNMGERGDLDL